MGLCWSGSQCSDVQPAPKRNVVNRTYGISAVNNVRVPEFNTRADLYSYVPSATHRYVSVTNTAVKNVPAPVRAVPVPSQAPKPCYGEFTCPRCGHSWHSLLSWPNVCQACRRCKTNARPKNQREVRPTDKTRKDDTEHSHPQELCQKCKQLGYHCSRSIQKRR